MSSSSAPLKEKHTTWANNAGTGTKKSAEQPVQRFFLNQPEVSKQHHCH